MPKDKVEVERFHVEARACRLGDPGYDKLCNRPEGHCRLCTALRTGFAYSLDFKRDVVRRGMMYGFHFILLEKR